MTDWNAPPRDSGAVYLGDGVYASFQHGAIVLQTVRADIGMHYIVLEPDTFLELYKFAQAWIDGDGANNVNQ